MYGSPVVNSLTCLRRVAHLASLCLAAAGLCALITFDAFAAGHQRCVDYGNKASEQTHKNQQQSCGFSGPRWKYDYGHHYNLCRNMNEAELQAETKARNASLAQCVANKNKGGKYKGGPAGPGAPGPGGTGQGGMEWGTNRQGKDYHNFAMSEPLPGICRRRCREDKKCRAWTFVKPGIQGGSARCWLKSSVPPPTPDSCCVSGVK